MPTTKTRAAPQNVNAITNEALRYLSFLKRDLIRKQRVFAQASKARAAAVRRLKMHDSAETRRSAEQAEKTWTKAKSELSAQQAAVDQGQGDLQRAKSEERIAAAEAASEEKIARLRERLDSKVLAEVDAALQRTRARLIKERLKLDEKSLAAAERKESQRLEAYRQKERQALEDRLSGRIKPGRKSAQAAATNGRRKSTNGRRKPVNGRRKSTNGRRKPVQATAAAAPSAPAPAPGTDS